MDGLVEWLRAQLDEDERIARAATPGPWVDQGGYVTDVGPRVQVTDYGTQDGEPEEDSPQGRADSAHIAEHDPARALREIDADRKLLAQFVEVGAREVDLDDAVEYADGWVNALGLAVRLRASVFSDRPGYREEWRP